VRYKKFKITNYRAIREPLEIKLTSRLVPIVGVNECGKTTILQAIFCFDYCNDKENGGRHLQNLENLYETTDLGPTTVEALIECDKTDLIEILDSHIAHLKTNMNETTNLAITEDETQSILKRINIFEKVKGTIPDLNDIVVQRNITSKYYSCSILSALGALDENNVCQDVLSNMPYTLYNDDFNDRPVDKVDLSTKEKDDWYNIYDRVFAATKKDYSLSKFIQEGELRRQSILKEVELYLSNTLTKAWAKFSPERKKISIEFSYKETPLEDANKSKAGTKELYIRVVETQSGCAGRLFSITDRSKGFIWYYNFIMKTMFNPKQSGSPKETIFLLDEPGSYLHEVAQASLCEKLSNIAAKEGIVIYCTHSPQLLNPKYVPLNSSLIVSKTNKKLITATPISSKNVLHSRKNTAMQPIYDALMIPEYEHIYTNEMILCVEGIYDKYCIECFCELSSDIRIFPSANADSIRHNIQYFIAYQKEYMALWDNDDEGIATFNKAKKDFGEIESTRFSLLPNVSEKRKTKMEDMIETEDYTYLSKKLGLCENVKYETLISTLHFMDVAERKKIISKISDKTKQNFAILKSIVGRILGANRN
jgi:predicted ATP-dependent endonuclease of OLD family